MATKTFTISNGSRGRAYELTYTVSSNDTTTTIKFTSITLTNTSWAGAPPWLNFSADVGGSGTFTPQTIGLFNDTLTESSPTKALNITKSWTRTTTAQTCRVYIEASFTTTEGTVSNYGGATISVSVPALQSYNVTYNANGGSNPPATQKKYYGIDLYLSTVKPTRSGFSFVKWFTAADGTGNGYDPGAKYSTNAALALYAKWSAVPSITSLTVIRSDENGDQDDSGTYAAVTATWTMNSSTSESATVTGTITPQGGTSSAITLSGATTGTGGTVTAIVPNMDTDTQYVVAITATNGSNTSTRSAVLTRAFFIMDFKAGGGGIGIGRAAPSDSLAVGYNAEFDGNVDIFGQTNIDSTLNTTGKITSQHNVQAQCYLILKANESNYSGIRTIPNGSAGRSTDAIRFYGTTDNADGDEIDIGNGGQVIVGAGESASGLHTALNAAVGSEQLYLASDGHVYLFSHCQTIGNRTQLMLNNSANVALYGRCGADHTVVLGNTSNNGVSSTTGVGLIQYQDKNGAWVGQFGSEINGSAGNVRSFIGARNIKTDGTAVTNYICIDVNKDGTQNYSVSSPANFRSAIGSNSAANLTTGTIPVARLTHVGWTYLTGSATASFYVRWCKVANIVHVEVLGSKSLSSNTNTKLAATAVASGSRPSKEVDSYLYSPYNHVGVLWIGSDGIVWGKNLGTAVTSVYGFLSYPVI